MRLVRRYCEMDSACRALMKMAIQRLGLSARGYGRILKVADLAGSVALQPEHLSERIQ